MRFKKHAFVILIIALCRTRINAQVYNAARAGFSSVEQIVLSTPQGKKMPVRLHAKPLTLLVFMSPECPLCRNYSIVLNELQDAYSKQVQTFGIVPGTAYEKNAIATFASAYKIQFPLLSDPQKEMAEYLSAAITPEVVLLDEKGTVVYRGAIDDWVEELGKKKIRPEKKYLEDAINQYLSGQAVTIKKTSPKGCYINEF